LVRVRVGVNHADEKNKKMKAEKEENRYSFNKFGVKISKADKYNATHVSIDWWLLKIWTLDSPSFELAFVIDTHWGIGITAIVPYLRIILAVPLPVKLEMWIYEKLNRSPKQ
jgi:hypothetical protein